MDLTISSDENLQVDYELKAEEHEFRGLASVFILVLLLVHFIYGYLRYSRHKVTQFGDKPAEIKKFDSTKKAFLEAIESDFIPSLMVYAVSASVGSFYFFMTLCFIMNIIGTILCTAGYAKNTQDFILAGRIIIVFGTMLAFLHLFSDDMIFKDE